MKINHPYLDPFEPLPSLLIYFPRSDNIGSLLLTSTFQLFRLTPPSQPCTFRIPDAFDGHLPPTQIFLVKLDLQYPGKFSVLPMNVAYFTYQLGELRFLAVKNCPDTILVTECG